MKTFKDRIRLESILVQLGHIRACGGTDPLGDLFTSTRGQSSHWVRVFIYAIEQVAHPGHLFNTPDWNEKLY